MFQRVMRARVGFFVALVFLPNALRALQIRKIKPDLTPACYQIEKSSRRVSSLLEIVSSRPTAQAYNTLGALFAEQNHTSCAIESFQLALRLDPSSWHSRYNLAVALVQTGNLQEAEVQLRKAIQQDPNSAAAHNALGLVLEKAKQVGPADEFNAAIRIDPRLSDATLNLVDLLSAEKKYSAAIYYLEKALGTNPAKESVVKLQIALGIAYGQNGESQKAVDILQKVVTNNPNSIDGHYNLGIVYANKLTPVGYRSAAREFQETLELDSGNSAARLALARAQISLKSYNEAIANVKAYIHQEPRHYEGYYNLGRAYRQQGNDQEAIAPLKRAATLAPENYQVRFDYGLVLAGTGRVEEAIPEFQAAEKIKPDDPQAHYQLGLLLSKVKQSNPSHAELEAFLELKKQQNQRESAGDLNNQANKLYGEGKYQLAAAIYRQVLTMNPDNAKWHYNYSLALAKLGDRKGEEQELQTVVRLDPNMADAHDELGLLYMGDHKLAEAEREFKLAIGINPQAAEAQNNLGVLYSQQGRDEEAASLFKQATQNDPHYTRAFINLGLTSARHGNFYVAEQQFDKALQLEPQNVSALTSTGMLLARLGHRQESIERFQEVAKLQPASADAHLNLGIAMADGYDPQGALKQFSEVVRLAPKSAEAHFNKGRVLYDLDRHTEARTELETAHGLEPNYPAPLYFLAAMDSPSPQSVTLLKQLLTLQPENSAAHYLLGQNLLHEGKTGEAIQHWKMAVKADPNNSSALYNLARALMKTHDPEAKQYMDQFEALQQKSQMNDRVHQLNNFALEAAQNHNWPLAVTQLKDAIEACGQCQAIATLHKNLGLIYARRGDANDAVSELELALQEDPQNADAHKALVLLHQQDRGISGMK